MSYTSTHEPRDVYHNVVIALDAAADINNGQPTALAQWINALDLRPGDRAYHLGCGVGYYTAIIAEMVGAQGSVLGCEVRNELALRACENLQDYPNVTVHAGDGAVFDPGECDAMLINAGVTLPSPLWLERLREGGRLVVPLTMATGGTLGTGIMAKIVRRGNGFSAEIVTWLAIYSCTGLRDAELEPLIKKTITTGAIMKLQSVRVDEHEQCDACLLHGKGVCLSSTAL